MKNAHRIMIEMHHAGTISGQEWSRLIEATPGLLADWRDYVLEQCGGRGEFERLVEAAKRSLTGLSALMPITWSGQLDILSALGTIDMLRSASPEPVFSQDPEAVSESEGGQSGWRARDREAWSQEIARRNREEPRDPRDCGVETVTLPDGRVRLRAPRFSSTEDTLAAWRNRGFISHDGQRIFADGRSAPL